jgi:RNA polymerase II-associated factor 1
MFPDRPPPIDPRDRALLRPLASLGKSSAAPSNVSFLRRTEYMTAHKSADPTGNARPSSNTLRTSQPRKPFVRPKASDKNDPAAMLRTIEKSFNLAYPKDAYTGPDTMEHIRGAEITRAEREAWDKPKHPTNSELKLLDSYPIIPDLAALGDTGSYYLIKYKTNPSTIVDYYDTRLDCTILVPSNSDEEISRYNDELAKHELDPEKHKKPQLKMDYNVYIPANDADVMVPRLKRKFDVYDADNDETDLYTDGLEANDDDEDNRGPHFRFKRLRAYETYVQTGDPDEQDPDIKWNDNVALALHDIVRDIDNDAVRRGVAPPRQKAAYVYPINQRHLIRPKRPATAAITGFGHMSQQVQTEEVQDDTPDVLELRIGEPEEEELQAMEQHRLALDSTLQQSAE